MGVDEAPETPAPDGEPGPNGAPGGADAGDGDPTTGEGGGRGGVQDLLRLEGLLRPGVKALQGAEHLVVPAWKRVTRGEPRWQVSVAVLAAVALQLSLPAHLAPQPRWILPVLEALLLIGLVVANPHRIVRHSAMLRVASMTLIATISAANAWSAWRLVSGLVQGTEHQDAAHLLLSGGAIWLTNVIVFSLWYWDLDRGGPAARAQAIDPYPDFLFAQMEHIDMAPPDWEPAFVDYLYLSFTNATAFSPTDVLPLSAWAKCTMMLQSAVSLATVALVIARAVNILS